MPVECELILSDSNLTTLSIINIFEYLKTYFTLKHDEKLNLES